jgi:hypothetical protein
LRLDHYKRFVWVFGVDPIPTLGYREVWSMEKSRGVLKNELVNLFFVEDIYGQSILVRIAKRILAP